MRKRALGIAAVTVAAVSVGVSTAGAVTSKPVVAVQVDEFSVFPGTQGAPAGTVRFIVTNIGQAEHEFVVIKSAKPAGDLLGGDHGPARADEKGAVGEIGSIPSGQAKVLSISLKPGHYALICNLVGHYKTGQFADFYVR